MTRVAEDAVERERGGFVERPGQFEGERRSGVNSGPVIAAVHLEPHVERVAGSLVSGNGVGRVDDES